MRKPQIITATAVTRGSDPRVSGLLRAVAHPAMPGPVAANLQISLGGHGASELRSVYFHNYFTDTGDTITVRIRLKNGHRVSVVSNSQMPLMLPWVTYGLDEPTVTYDARLSRAIAALLPKSAPSYDLLSGHGDMGWPQPGEAIDLVSTYSARSNGGNCLRQYIREHPEVKIRIHLDGDLSLSFRAQEQLLSDLYHAGETGMIDDIAGQLQIYTWVTLSSKAARTEWVVGPNNLGTILWRRSGSPILGTDKPPASRFMAYSLGPC